jgi:hypothetical protein
MHAVDFGDLQGHVAHAACLTNRIDSPGTVLFKEIKGVSQPTG